MLWRRILAGNESISDHHGSGIRGHSFVWGIEARGWGSGGRVGAVVHPGNDSSMMDSISTGRTAECDSQFRDQICFLLIENIV